MSKLVSVVIVNYNTRNLLKRCFDSVYKQNYRNFEIIFFDNGSIDGSANYVKKNFPKVKATESNINLGLSEGRNRAIASSKGDLILFIDTDTILKSDLLAKLVKEINKEKNLGIVQPKVLFPKTRKIQQAGVFITDTGFLYYPGYGKSADDPRFNKEIEIFSSVGCCMLVKRDVFKSSGNFDKDLFAYFEETDFCWRALLSGFKIKYLPSAEVFHLGSKTSKTLGSDFMIFHSFKNRICSIIKNSDLITMVKILPVHLLLCQAASFIYLISGRCNGFLAIQKALFWNIKNFKETLRKRYKIQTEIRKVSDFAIMSQLKKNVKLIYYFYLFGDLEKYNE